MTHYDAIVIGSGLGGLTCGTTLAVNKKKVLVLEQHSRIGGCSSCFPRKGTLIDVGLHEIDFGDPRSDAKHKVFDHIGLWERVKFVKLPTAWTIKEGDKDYVIPHGDTPEALKEMFPHESEGMINILKKSNFKQERPIDSLLIWGFLSFFLPLLRQFPSLPTIVLSIEAQDKYSMNA